MPLPMYQGLNAPSSEVLGNANHGLWFERYFSAYASDFAEIDEDARREWLKNCQRKQGNKEELRNKAAQTLHRVRSFGGDARIYRCAGRFVSGIGNAHPLENGFSWHPTLGMPYLPGSAIKGLVRAVIETALDASAGEKAALLKLWFGTANKGDVAEQAGAFIFMDALPVSPCELKAEVLTPHMGKWYEKGGKSPQEPSTMPGDWHSPVPITWLVANNLSLQFAIMPRPGTGNSELDELWEALEYGLQYLGAGAKTSIGFGIFELDKESGEVQQLIEKELQNRQAALAKQQHLQALANASEEQRCIVELQDYLEALPDRMPAGHAENVILWEKVNFSIDLISEQGDAAQKAELYALIKGARDRKFTVSKKNEKKFKELLTKLHP